MMDDTEPTPPVELRAEDLTGDAAEDWAADGEWIEHYWDDRRPRNCGQRIGK